ncbi:hypothetical protein [Bradyrhizobium sp. AZCC 1708]|uniref:hypothetical protein n=1 Tax=Bradyrhizobium sp. AZCC 1708 TaxID=3117015 RepID=UPI002FF4016E
MSKFISAVIIGLVAFVLVRVIAGALDLDPKAYRLGQLIAQVSPHALGLLGWAVAAIAAIVAMVLWLTFRVDDRIRDLWSARPPIGSLQVVGNPTMKVEVQGPLPTIRKVELAVELKNTNPMLLKIDAILRATVNGKDLDQPIVFSGYVGAHSTTHFIVQMTDVPLNGDAAAMQLEGKMRYDVRYRFDSGKGERRTSKLVQWETRAPLSGKPFSERSINVFTRFFDEIEE